MVIVSLVAAESCAARRESRSFGAGGEFVELYPVAERRCEATLAADALGTTITLHFEPEIGKATARRFLEALPSFQREREADYDVLRQGLRTHLGESLFSRVQDSTFLQARQLETDWFLMVGEAPQALMWRGPPDSRYHFLPLKGAGDYTDEELRVHSSLQREVRELTHWTIWRLVHSRRGCLPRWLEEGICDYVAMQYQRWSNKKWDDARELEARLAWDRPVVREHLIEWTGPNDGMVARRRAIREPNWIADLHFSGSRGLVFALESELGDGGLLDLFKRLLLESPETDSATVAIIESAVGKPIREVGLMQPTSRRAALEGLLERAETACDTPPDADDLPLRALGHFFEAPDVVFVLRSLAACENDEVADEGLAGLSLLGRPDAVRQLRDELGTARLERLDSWYTARELLESPSKAERWFAVERARQ